MPITGIKDTRRKQLIDATLASVAEYGLQNTTINSISRLAGMSSGIISHYFGGKQELIEATVRQLLEELKQALLSRACADIAPQQRLLRIVEANFTEFQRSRPATKSWLSFWAQAMHDPRLARLQQVNSQRLISNLRYSFRPLLGPEQAKIAARQTAALIDGFWLRSALSTEPDRDFREGEQLCKKFITDLLRQHGVNACH